MATAKKLPSGSWRVQVVDHYEKGPDGKRKIVRQTFISTDPSKAGKAEAERMAAEWEYTHKKRPEAITVSECIRKYIDAKKDVLSPSTVFGYEIALRKHYSGSFGGEGLRGLTDEKVQLFVSSLSASGFSGKSVRNIYSLFSSAALMFGCSYRVTLPRKKNPETYTPIDKEVNKLLDYVKGGGEKREELYDFILLSAFGSLRRGEIACLENTDITKYGVKVNKDMIMDENKIYVINHYAKTDESNREAMLPPMVIERLKKRCKKSGRIFPGLNPHMITMRFIRAVRAAGVPYFRFHDLRHYWVSIAHALGMPEQYILDNGGWKTSHVMKRVYRDTLSDVKKKESAKINKHFEKLMK